MPHDCENEAALIIDNNCYFYFCDLPKSWINKTISFLTFFYNWKIWLENCSKLTLKANQKKKGRKKERKTEIMKESRSLSF